MPLMQEAVSKENWDRMEKGLRPLKPERVVIPEPEKPVVENEIKFDDIPNNYEVELEHAQRKSIRNAHGILFIGFDITLNLVPIEKKRGPGRPPKEPDETILEAKTLTGWMLEGEFLKLVRTYRKKIDQQVIHW